MNNVDITEELGKNFLTYAIDVDQNKAFPAVADGLLPGARAALWEMYKQKYTSNKPHVKSAKVASGVIGKWWPHNADATYGTLVRMAQPFVENVLEIDFQGAVGNIVLGQQSYGSSRYTEMRLSKLAEDGLFQGIDKNNSDMILNYSQDEEWPKVLPAIFPRLLVNGSVGLGVGISQNFALHNFTETANLIVKYVNEGILDEDNYFPDYPTGGIIVNKDELAEINKTGKGRVIIEAEYVSYPKEHKIVFTGFPYQVYIEDVIKKVKTLVNDEKIVSVDDIENTTDKNNISITVYVDKKYDNEYCVNELFSNTPLRSQYHIIQNAIVNQVPELVSLRQIVDVYVKHNSECIRREFEFDLNKTIERIDILKSLIAAVDNIDDVISIIKEDESSSDTLRQRYGFSENGVRAVLDMRLARLSRLEKEKLETELQEKESYKTHCESIVGSQERQREILVQRLQDLVERYGDARRTKVIQKSIEKSAKSKSKKEKVVENVVITFNPIGSYLQNIPLAEYRDNGLAAFKMTTDDKVILFSNHGNFYRIAPKDIKSCGPKDKGTACGAILQLGQGEKIVLAVSGIVDEKRPYVIFTMFDGEVKKSEISTYCGNTRNLTGKMAVNNYSQIVGIHQTNGDDIILTTYNGYKIRFDAESVRPTGRSSHGIKGITFRKGEGDYVLESEVVSKDDLPQIPRQTRGGKGKRY